MLSPPAKVRHTPIFDKQQGGQSMDVTVKRGDVFFADLSPVVGSEQGGNRPVLIIQNNVGNHYSPTVIVAAITSKIQNPKCPLMSVCAPSKTGLSVIQSFCLNRFVQLISNGYRHALPLFQVPKWQRWIEHWRYRSDSSACLSRKHIIKTKQTPR